MSDRQRNIPSKPTKVPLAGDPDGRPTTEHTRLPDHSEPVGPAAPADPHKAFGLFPAAPPSGAAPASVRSPGTAEPSDPSRLTPDGADWLASASAFPESVHALWRHRPASSSVLPCGTVFDVVSAAPLLGQRLLDQLWSAGAGSGPVALHRDRLLLFTAPGTAHRLPALLGWGEWRELFQAGKGDAETFPPLLCHGAGDVVTIPAPAPLPYKAPKPHESQEHHEHEHHGHEDQDEPHKHADRHDRRTRVPASRQRPDASAPADRSRWLVAPDVRHPWLPGPDDLLWACVHSYRPPASPRTPPSRFRAGRGPNQHRTINFRNGGS